MYVIYYIKNRIVFQKHVSKINLYIIQKKKIKCFSTTQSVESHKSITAQALFIL